MRAVPKPVISANLDLLRAVAVLCVFFAHLMDALGRRSFGSLGRFGVILFFVHTSFVLMGSLERLQQTGSSSDRTLTLGFWCRRLFRIYPLSILFVGLVAVFRIPSYPAGIYEWIGWKAVFSNLALTQNLTYSRDILSPLWSLPLEVQMYVLLPFLYFAIRGRRYVSVGLWVASVALALTIPRVSERLSVFSFGPCFTSGVVAFDLIRRRGWRWRAPAWVWPIGIAVAIALFGPHDNVSLGMKMERAWAVSLLIGVVYAHVEEASENVFQPLLHWIADHSYGIYLSHMVVIWFAIYVMAGAPLWARVAVLIVGSVAIPAGLYVAIEKPLILVGSHVARRLMAHSSKQKQERFA
jgi:peptidoglycan/LPS O-acetylase OafA/YrhL